VTPVLIPVDPCANCNNVSEFDVLFDAFVEGVGTMQHVAHFAINAGQPLVFGDVVVGPHQSTAFHVTFDLLTTEDEVMATEDLFVVTITAALALPGDYNGDGTVDSADFVVWRKTDGTPAGYNTWRAHFGQIAGTDSVAVAPADHHVPEPVALYVIFMAAIGCGLAHLRNSWAGRAF
jgi:hypothetical protein